LQLNLGILPSTQPPVSAFALGKRPSTLDDLARERIDFDSDGPEGKQFEAFAVGATGLSKFQDIPWPDGLAPKPFTKKQMVWRANSALPAADVLVVTWTVDEGHALSRVLTPDFDSKNDWKKYTHNYATIAKHMRAGCPARNAKRLGSYWLTRIGDKKVLCFKSESHLSQDGPPHPKKITPTLANFLLWKQLIQEVKPKLVLTTGTGGGIGKQWEVGDVIVSPIVRFLVKGQGKAKPKVGPEFDCRTPVRRSKFKQARELFKTNAAHLPNTNTRKIPDISLSKTFPTSIVSTNFFGFDTSTNIFQLRGTGDLSEMGDVVLGAVAQSLGRSAPPWVAVRNVSDPQINDPKKSVGEQAQEAAAIYKAYGKWSSVCSAIVCWALITG
jgi:nucleoside phosphorylase